MGSRHPRCVRDESETSRSDANRWALAPAVGGGGARSTSGRPVRLSASSRGGSVAARVRPEGVRGKRRRHARAEPRRLNENVCSTCWTCFQHRAWRTQEATPRTHPKVVPSGNKQDLDEPTTQACRATCSETIVCNTEVTSTQTTIKQLPKFRCLLAPPGSRI